MITPSKTFHTCACKRDQRKCREILAMQTKTTYPAFALLLVESFAWPFSRTSLFAGAAVPKKIQKYQMRKTR